jgi:hypothetical protein
MASRSGLVTAVLVGLLTVAACTQSGGAGSGGVGEPTAAGSAAPSGAASAPASTPAATATASAAASAAASAGTAATGACALISGAEASDILGFDVTVNTGSGESICIYEVAGVGALVGYLETATVDPATTVATFKASPDVKPVDGIGDAAFWQPAYLSAKLFALKGTKLVSIAVGSLNGVPVDGLPSDISPDKLLDMAKQFGTLAVGRM